MIVNTRVKLYANEKHRVLLEKHIVRCIFVYYHFLEENKRDWSDNSIADRFRIHVGEDC